MTSLTCMLLLCKSVEGQITLKWLACKAGILKSGQWTLWTGDTFYDEILWRMWNWTRNAKSKLCLLFQATWPGWMRLLRRLKLLWVWLSTSASFVERHPRGGTLWWITLRRSIIQAATNAATAHSFSLPKTTEMCTSAENTNTHEMFTPVL